MLAWQVPEPPRPEPPAEAVPVRVFDTATAGLVEVGGPGDRPVSMYVCGITPYDATHLGHANTYVGFDLLHRVWRDAGRSVRYVQNVTDVDDPLLERAAATGVDWRRLAEEQTQLFREDMAALNVLPPTSLVGAVESVPRIVPLVQRLQAVGAAYGVPSLAADAGADPGADPGRDDVYLSADADPAFGSVARLPEAEALTLFAERGGDPDRPGKKNPLDSLLWRQERPGEPAWASDLGSGRPGWHVECAAIALDLLGPDFDVQGGGSDLAFPHHEMSASTARLATDRPFARSYVHSGMVGLDGEKMSKSRGNLVLVSRMRAAGVEPAAIRLALLSAHYRADWTWTDDRLAAARQRLARWRTAVGRPAGPPAAPLLAGVRAALADDLDAPAALAAVDRWAAATGEDPAAPRAVADACDALLGVRLW